MHECTQTEKVLAYVAFFVVAASIAMAINIGFVLPYHWTTEGYINDRRDKDADELAAICQCDRKKITTNYINCIPKSFSNRLNHPASDVHEETCELIQDYPYVVSLNVAAYKDDNKERRLACTGTIVSKHWVFIGEDCVFDEDEFNAVKLRAGSTYWSKGGNEYLLIAIAKYSDQGPTAVKVSKAFKFGKYVSPANLPKKGIYTTWISAVSVKWRKDRKRKHDKFVVQKWTTTPCTDHCHTGKVMGNPSCGKNKFEATLVAENRLLVGFQTGFCNYKNTTQVMFIDVQTDSYQNWFKFLLGDDYENVNRPSNQLERHNEGTTASPIDVYEERKCIVTQPSYTEDLDKNPDKFSGSGNTSRTEKDKMVSSTEPSLVRTTPRIKYTKKENQKATSKRSSDIAQSTLRTEQANFETSRQNIFSEKIRRTNTDNSIRTTQSTKFERLFSTSEDFSSLEDKTELANTNVDTISSTEDITMFPDVTEIPTSSRGGEDVIENPSLFSDDSKKPLPELDDNDTMDDNENENNYTDVAEGR